MNYQNHYDKLIRRAKNRKIQGYYEKHHIIPKCVGGLDDPDNIAFLTAREHYIAHQLLVKIYNGNYALVRAANYMTTFSTYHHTNRSKNRLYEWLRKKLSAAMSESQAGEGNSQYGKIWISNPDTGINKKIEKTQNIPEGFYQGRNLKWKKCLSCNKLFISEWRKTCSDSCYKIQNSKPKEKLIKTKKEKVQKRFNLVCKNCKTEFISTNKNKKCCSKHCATIVSTSAASTKKQRKVQDDNNIIFTSLSEAAENYNITVEAVRYRIRIGRYSYID